MASDYVMYFSQGDPNLPESWRNRGMPSEPAHDLEGFLDRVATDLAQDYEQIHARASEDPGTAGDQSEQTWAELLRRWLPPTLTVTTKGRIISEDGRMSSQLDVVVLRDTYPRALAEKKVYLAAGVLAVFECKLTLRAADIRDAGQRGQALKALVGARRDGRNVRGDLVPPLAYGVLAHRAERLDIGRVDSDLLACLNEAEHPREAIDVLCVASLGCWSAVRHLLLQTQQGRLNEEAWAATRARFRLDPDGGIHVTYARWAPDVGVGPANPVYALIGFLLRTLAADLPNSSVLARYWDSARVRGNSRAAAAGRSWPMSILSESVRAGIAANKISVQPGDSWSTIFY